MYLNHFKKLVVCFLMGMCFTAQSSNLNSEVSESSIIIEREPYRFSYNQHSKWLDFMDKAKNQAWQADNMRTLFDKTTYERYQSQDTLKSEKLVYLSDGLKIKAYLIAPKDKSKKYPVVIFAHGGVAKWGRITFVDLLEMHRLAEQGYVVLASALRGEGGSEGKPNLGAGEINDIMALLDVAEHIESADTNKVGFWGFSRGGGLGYRVMAQTDRFQAALLIGAPSDLINNPRRAEFDEHVYPDVIENYAVDKDAALISLSAAFWPERLSQKSAIFLAHGAEDERVNISHSLTMAEHLSRLGRKYRLVVFENGSHTLIEHHIQLREQREQWFEAHLKH